MAAGIYAIRYLPSNEMKIGSSRNLEEMSRTWQGTLRHGNPFTESSNYYQTVTRLQDQWNRSKPEDFDFIVLEEINGDDSLQDKKTFWINLLNPSLNGTFRETTIERRQNDQEQRYQEWKRKRDSD